ncbi:hypothetical protein JHK84_052444 [Glycine max]|nr:hypothetical protein JHK84_052444 [Glycine max]
MAHVLICAVVEMGPPLSAWPWENFGTYKHLSLWNVKGIIVALVLHVGISKPLYYGCIGSSMETIFSPIIIHFIIDLLYHSLLLYFLPFATEGIKNQIEQAIHRADKIGVKVISLGALNKV